jgi:hypothetical protein
MHNKARNVTYVYESESYWDREKKQPRSRRRLVGKVDPETGEVVPTGPRGRPRKGADAAGDDGGALARALDALAERDAQLAEARAELAAARREVRRLEGLLRRVRDVASGGLGGDES